MLVSAKQNVDAPRFLPVLKTPGVPRMRVDSTSSIKDLNKWNRMYQKRFFNPDERILTGKDVCETLSYQPIPPSPFTCLTPGVQHQRKSKLRPRHRSLINQKAHVHNTSRDLIPIIGPVAKPTIYSEEKVCERMTSLPRLESPDIEPPEKSNSPHSCISNKSTKSGSCDSFDSDEEDRELQKLKVGPETNVAIRLRRPRFSVLPSVKKEENQCRINGPLVDSWCPWNYVTFPDHAPFTPQSYYVQNFPLLLSKIPKRSEDDDDADMGSWRPLRATPDIDLAFFDNLPTNSLSWHSLSDSDGEPHSDNDTNSVTHNEK